MKKVLLVLLASIAVVSCKKVADNEFIITGKAEGVKDGSEIYLNKQDSMGVVHVDTVKVKDGKFQMEGKLKNGPLLHFIQMKDVQGGFPFVLESGEIEIKINKDTLGKSKVSGTYSNDKLTEYTEAYTKIDKKMQAFQKANMSKWQEAVAKNDTVTRNVLIKENKKFQEEIKALSLNHIEKYPKSFISVYFLEQFSMQPDADIAKIKKLYEALDPELKKAKPAKNVLKNLKLIEAEKTKGPSVGAAAPDFTAPSPEGKPVSLKQSLGKLTLVDFWASWCGPCRKESPNVVALYNEFHPKGLNIISVSLDKEAAKWKEAIVADKLAWTHVSNLKYWQDPIAAQYNVKSIPAMFLLDESGVIIAKDLQGEALKTKVASILK
ncbi:TlpA disulfide reductase family protein [Flavobacterium sp.]|uniref:TlpA disulfide reductase family protein n=1 Tax=Flavobacterium sp. TaxID=239 RepID=UPI00260A659B|nr:TlpA disulfide reductase family protein [Flavobacterium sp.]